MRVDANLQGTGVKELATEARGREANGYDGLWTTEKDHDPFLPLMPVVEHTEHLSVGTAIAVAFARNPMSMAYLAHDLQMHAQGRFLLGLGSQVKPHIERRFQMPWSHPAARMREYVQALRAIWASWQTGERLDFRGEFYSHTLMTAMFSPGPNPWGPPKVYLAAVGEHMTRVAGEVCDGLLPHPFTTERYLRERTLPRWTRASPSPGVRWPTSPSASVGSSSPGATRRRWPPPSALCGGRSPSTAARQATSRCWNCTAGPSWASSSTGSPAAPTPTAGSRWATSSTTRCYRPSPWSPSRTRSAPPC